MCYNMGKDELCTYFMATHEEQERSMLGNVGLLCVFLKKYDIIKAR